MRHFHYERSLNLSYNTILPGWTSWPGEPGHTLIGEKGRRRREQNFEGSPYPNLQSPTAPSRIDGWIECHGTDIKGLRSYLVGDHTSQGFEARNFTAGPVGVPEAAVASEHALLVGQETGFVLPCPR